MQFTLVSVSFLAALAAAQNSTSSTLPSLVAQLPKCAMSCFQSAASGVSCSTTDFKCLCDQNKRSQFTSSIGICLFGGSGGCSSEDNSKLISLAGQICGVVESNPAPSDIAQASSLVTAALGTATATSSSRNAAPAQTLGSMGILGAAAIAAMAL